MKRIISIILVLVLDFQTIAGGRIQNTLQVPSKPVNVSAISSGARSMTIYWKPPLKPNGVIIDYQISYGFINNSLQSKSDVQHREQFMISDNVKVDNQTFELVLDDLYYWSYYKFCIKASTKIGYGESVCVVERTDEYVPTSEVMNLTVNHKDFQSITISFNEPQYPNGIITGYIVKYTYKDHVCRENLSNATLKVNIEKNILVKMLVGNTIVYTVNNLFNCWSYTFTVLPKTKKGNGTVWSSNLTTMTDGNLPGQIRKFTEDKGQNIVYPNITSTSISVQWNEPCFPNGIITKYHIRIKNKDGIGFKDVKTYGNSTQWQLVDLLPYTDYNICIAAENDIGTGSCFSLPPVRTLVDGPYRPSEVIGTVLSCNSIKVNWAKPPLYTGPTTYIVNAIDDFNKNKTKVCKTQGFQNTTCIVEGLDEFWDYRFTVTAITSKGHNISEPSAVVKTKELTPGKVSELLITLETNISKPIAVSLSWKPPALRDRNGVILSYYVTFNGPVWRGEGNSLVLNETYLNSFQLRPETCYTIQVIAKTSIGNGTISQIDKCMPAGAPIKPKESKSKLLMQKDQSTAVKDSEKQIAIKLPLEFLCSDDNGKPVQWGVIVSEASQIGNDPPFVGKKDDYLANKLRSYKTWSEVQDNDVIVPYVATRYPWTPACEVRNKPKAQIQQSAETFIIGESGECKGVVGNCNGYLQPGRSYKVKSYVCTNGGCTETHYSEPISTDPKLELEPAIVGELSGAVILLIVIAVVMFILRRRKVIRLKERENNSTGDDVDYNANDDFEMEIIENRPVNLNVFAKYYNTMSANSNMKFKKEYQTLKNLSPVYPTEVAFLNVSKNRYGNILPFDHTRVKLLPLSNDCAESADYINANYIPGYYSPREFIATQGPVESTANDFWRMIWEQNVAIIVMLVQCMERGRVKCFNYWPDEVNVSVFYGGINVTVEKETNYRGYILRAIILRLGDYSKKVQHFAYLIWPDTGCPKNGKDLFTFVKQVRQAVPASINGPITVHCSAGVGRTGTFIVVDDLLNQIDNGCTEVDIFGLVLNKRHYRTSMVQSEDQYVYIHKCVMDYISYEDDDGHEDSLYEYL